MSGSAFGTFRKGLEDLGNGLYAWLQPDGSWYRGPAVPASH